MKLRQVLIELIDVPKVRVTAVYDEEQLKLLRETLDAMGQVQPAIVIAHDGRYEIVDGKHRLDEAKAKGDTHLSCVVYEGSPADGLLMNLVLNKVRGKTKASEMVAVIEELWQTHKMDSEDIGAKTGLTRDYIERLMVISKAAPSVRQALDQEVIGVGHAYELARIPSVLIQEEIVAKQQLWRWSVKDLREQVDNVLAEMQKLEGQPIQRGPTPPPPPVVYHCQGCQREANAQDLRPVNICPDCFGRIWRLAKRTGEAPDQAPEASGGA